MIAFSMMQSWVELAAGVAGPGGPAVARSARLACLSLSSVEE